MPTYTPTPSPYVVDFSDPTKTPITVQPATKDGPGQLQHSTSITIHGQNSLLYGEGVNENFLRIVEHFANATPPLQPIEGQIWLNNSSTYEAGFNETLAYKQGDHLFRVFRRRKDPNAPTNFITYWTTINPTIVDVDITNRLAFTAESGHLWYDMDVSDDVDVPSASSWDHPQLKIYDPNDGWVSIGRNYIQKIGNQTLTGTWTVTDDIIGQQNILITGNSTVQGNSIVSLDSSVGGTFTVTGVTTLNGATTITKLLTLSSTTGQALNVTSGTSTFATSTTFNGSITANGTSTFTNTITANAIANFNALVTINAASAATTGLTVNGSVITSGNITSAMTGTFNALSVTTTAGIGGHLTMTGASNEIRANVIDMRNNNIKNLLDPTLSHHAATKGYADSTFLARDASLGAGANAMTAVLVLNNGAQNGATNNAATVGYVNTERDTRVAKAGDTMSGDLQLLNNSGVVFSHTGNSLASPNTGISFMAGNDTLAWNVYELDSGTPGDLVFNAGGSLLDTVRLTQDGYVVAAVPAVNPNHLIRKGEVDAAISSLSTSVSTTLANYTRIWAQTSAPAFGAGNAKSNGDVWINTTNSYIYISAGSVWRKIFPAEWA